MQPTAPQRLAPLQTPQEERPRSSQPREAPPDTEIPRCPTTEGTSTSLSVPAARSASHSRDNRFARLIRGWTKSKVSS
ncbi:hypothetical protein GW17_00025308 [Ensete ventricosum]|nr:hypothetical protein GW17_00025308 [Ensete ventricosum]